MEGLGFGSGSFIFLNPVSSSSQAHQDRAWFGLVSFKARLIIARARSCELDYKLVCKLDKEFVCELICELGKEFVYELSKEFV